MMYLLVLMLHISLHETQEGLGGTVVKSWIVTENKWIHTKSYFDLDGKEKIKIVRSGKLSKELKITFDLPKVIGSESKVNRHFYSLQMGNKTSVLHGVPIHRKNKLKNHMISWLEKKI